MSHSYKQRDRYRHKAGGDSWGYNCFCNKVWTRRGEFDICICLLADTFYQCPDTLFLFVCVCVCVWCQYFYTIKTAQLLGMKICLFFVWWVGWRVCARLVVLQVIADKMKIYYLHVGKMQKAHEQIPYAYTAEFI